MIERADPLWERIRLLRSHAGEPAAFWKEYLELLAGLAKAEWAVLLRRTAEKPGDGDWQAVASFPADRAPAPEAASLAARVAAAATAAGGVSSEVAGTKERPLTVAGAPVSAGERVCAVVCVGWKRAGACSDTERLTIQLLSDLPQDYLDRRGAQAARDEAASYRLVLEAVSAVCEQDHHLSACMTLCNELAVRLKSEQVSLGLLRDNRYVELQAISGTSRFDKHANAAKSLEVLMEEALDQDDDIVFPVPEGFTVVAREHEHYSGSEGARHIATILLRRGEEAVGAVCCRRSSDPFREAEIRQASLIGEMCAERILQLEERGHWFGPRMLSGLRRRAARLIGPEHTWAKTGGIAVAVLLAVLFFGRATHRVRTPFTLKTHKLSIVSMPCDGTVESVRFDIGDRVEAGKELMSLDSKPLLLEAAALVSSVQEHTREAEKHRAESRLADMRIAEALARQDQARLELVQYRIDRSVIRSPLAGVVVEGRWEDRIHAPVREGELVARIAQLDRMFVELEVDVADIAFVSGQARAEIAFISAPRTRYQVAIVRIDPAVTQGRSGPVVIARAECTGEVLDWWRPGMTGVARIDAGRRSLWWILTHRTSDFLDRALWW